MNATSVRAADADLIAVCRQRPATYGLLARLFRVEIDRAFLDELSSLHYPAATGNALLDDGYRRIARFVGGAWEGTLTELAVDYVRTFIGSGTDGFSAAYPYESVHVSEKRLLMQDVRDEVRALYLSAGLQKGASWNEGEDHVALELEYMGILAQRAADALDAGDDAGAVRLLASQRNFLRDHLAVWIPTLAADMRRFAQTGLYQGLSLVVEGFVAEDLAFLDEILVDDAEADDAGADDAGAETEA